MSLVKSILTAAIAATAFAAATPASAVVGFASYSPKGNLNNIRYTTGGNGGARPNNGVYETVSAVRGPTGRVTYTPGAVDVKFSFLYPEFSGIVDGVDASFAMNVTVTKNTAPTTTTGAFDYGSFNGTFSFKTKSAIAVGGPLFVPHIYPVGSILLAGKIVNGKLSGTFGQTAGSLTEAGAQTTYQFSSDFLDFSNVSNIDFSQSLTSVTNAFALRLASNPALGLQSFTALSGGTFSSDPLPLINGLAIVPEPAVWSMLIVGFGLVGVQSRRRSRMVVTA